MHPLNVFFDKIYVISIPRNKERIESFLSRTKGIDIEIFDGIDGKSLYPQIKYVKDFPEVFFKEFNISFARASLWNKGQLGCALSNLNIQKLIIEKKIGKTLILEDDALIIENRLKSFEDALYELPSNWELFYLGYNNISKWSGNFFARALLRIKYRAKPISIEGNFSDQSGKMFWPKTFSSSLYTPGVYFGTHAYALTLGGAEKIVDIDTPLKYGFDTTLLHVCYHKLINAYALKKPLFIPQPGLTTTLIN